MNCPKCGSPLYEGDAFCGVCGAPATGASDTFAPEPAPAPAGPQPIPPQPIAPTAVMPIAQPPAGPPQPAAYPPASPAPAPFASAPAAKKGLSGGAIFGIVAGVVALLVVLGIGGFFGVKAIIAKKQAAEVASQTQTWNVPPEETATEDAGADDAGAEDPAATDTGTDAGTTGDTAAGTSGGTAGGTTGGNTAAPDDEIITDEQARATVAGFLDARIARDVEASRAFCSLSYWNGENHDMLVDDTWRPETYEIVKTQPDLMYIHVVVLTNWPSGDEYMIWSTMKDPSTGRPLIDGTLDPQYVPEMLPQ